jgi:glyoxylase-like metal-dependent hydrolase (beta-lactamase superfamily II)
MIGRFTIGGIEFSVLESMGGHMHAQTFFLSDEHKLLFTGDSLMPFESLTDERKRYNLHAKNIMMSVNVDSAKAVAEREALMELASGMDGCIICPGHGALSKITNGKLETCGAVERYVHKM